MNLVVVPSHRFGRDGVRMGLIHGSWLTVEQVRWGTHRGQKIESWYYLNDLDAVPPPNATIEELEAWLERPDRGGVDECPQDVRDMLDVEVQMARMAQP